jgi:DNA-binding CsgD family transcriptional regulator/tetratricopeptide (TPR) repeat protein
MRGERGSLGLGAELLERAAELDAITAAIGAAVAGSGTVLLIEGPAGIGKTRLLGHACAQAADAGLTVLTARAAEFEDGYAWGVVRQLFGARAAGGPAGSGEPGGAADPADDAVALARLALSHRARPGVEDTFSVLHGLYWLTADIARRGGPVLLAIDDLHWADRPSQRFTIHLARRLEGLPVLLAATIRDPRAGTVQGKELTATLTAEPGVWLLRPAALSPAGSARMVSLGMGANTTAGFASACHDLTGGNPLLLRGLITALAAEGAAGDDTDIPHLRRLTPDVVSRHVLLRLARLPAGVLATARAIAVLGTSATTTRAARLAGLDAAAGADAVATLMAEQLVTGDVLLSFVHPLVRSVIYTDLAPPLRQRWHKRAARLLAEIGGAAEVTTHLLATAPEGDPWVVARLRTAAADARARGAPDVAVHCLERALAEPPADSDRAAILHELGTAQTPRAPARAVDHLTQALALAGGRPASGEIALALSEALALQGHFADATRILREAVDQADDRHVAGLQAALLNTTRWDLSSRSNSAPLLKQLLVQAEATADLDPRLHANLAVELCDAGTDQQRAVRHAQAAVRATSQLTPHTPTVLPEAVIVLLCADDVGAAAAAAQDFLHLAQRRGHPVAAAVAAAAVSMIAYYSGEIRQALAYGLQAVACDSTWIPGLATGLVVPVMLDAGDVGGARALLEEHDLFGELPTLFPFNVTRQARGCLHAAEGNHEAAVTELLALGDLATRWGVHNPAMLPWRSAAAVSLSALGDLGAASRLAADEIELARRWGSKRSEGIALRAAGLAAGGERGVDLLTEAVATLRASPARLELARALADLGAAHRRAGARALARDLLRESLDLAHALGGHAIAARARQELVTAGGRPRRDARHGRDALTPSELRVVELAAAGRSNRQIAQALFVTKRTVENHLTSAYAKLGISARHELAASLTDSPQAAPATRQTAPTSR